MRRGIVTTHNEYTIELPAQIVQRIETINRGYLQLIKEICDIDPCAPAIVGIPDNLVDLIRKTRMSTLSRLARCGYLLPCLSVDDTAFWKRVSDGDELETDTLEQFLVRMPEWS